MTALESQGTQMVPCDGTHKSEILNPGDLSKETQDNLRLFAKDFAEFQLLPKWTREAQEQNLRAGRRCGERLREIGATVGNPQWSPKVTNGVVCTLRELGVTKRHSVVFKQLADIPLSKFEQMIRDGKNLSRAAFIRAAYPELAAKKKANKAKKPTNPKLDALAAFAARIVEDAVDAATAKFDAKALKDVIARNHSSRTVQQALKAYAKLLAGVA